MSFSDLISGLGSAISDVFDGREFHLVTVEGVEIDVPGVFNKAHREVSVGDYGAKTWSTVPRLDLNKAALIEAGLADPERDLHGAAVEIDGTAYTIAEPRDGSVFVRCILSLNLDHS